MQKSLKFSSIYYFIEGSSNQITQSNIYHH